MKVRGLARKEERSHNQPAKGDVILGQVHFRGDLANTAIMVMTANLDPALKVQYEERGCRLYLNKPLTLEALEFALAAVIGKLRREQPKWPLMTS